MRKTKHLEYPLDTIPMKRQRPMVPQGSRSDGTPCPSQFTPPPTKICFAPYNPPESSILFSLVFLHSLTTYKLPLVRVLK